MTTSSFDKMIEEHGARILREKYHVEIERAIGNLKRSTWDKWFRREWYRAAGRRRSRKGPSMNRDEPNVDRGCRKWGR